jgi:hypothetical protein
VTRRDINQFQQYLRQCTDRQVIGVYEKERAAGRRAYVQLAALEMAKRRLDVPGPAGSLL